MTGIGKKKKKKMFGATFGKELFELKFLNRDEGWSRHGEWEISGGWWNGQCDSGKGGW